MKPVLLGILLVIAGCKDPQLSRCEAFYEPLKNYSEMRADVDKLLKQEGVSFDQLIERRCKYWISNGQQF